MDNERLDYSKKGLDKLQDLRQYTKLQRLNLSGNNLSGLQGIANNKTLTWLNISHNEVTDLSPLKNLQNLSVINASYNNIKSVKALNAIKGLKALILNNNEISSFDGLEDLKDLNSLVLSNNKIKTIETSGFTSLAKLSLSHNSLDEFPDFQGNLKMKEIRFNQNCISSVPKSIQHCKYLQLLDLGNNKISSFSALEGFKGMKFLININLKGNPICSSVDYFEKMMNLCPSLRVLDGRKVDDMQSGDHARTKAIPEGSIKTKKASRQSLEEGTVKSGKAATSKTKDIMEDNPKVYTSKAEKKEKRKTTTMTTTKVSLSRDKVTVSCKRDHPTSEAKVKVVASEDKVDNKRKNNDDVSTTLKEVKEVYMKRKSTSKSKHVEDKVINDNKPSNKVSEKKDVAHDNVILSAISGAATTKHQTLRNTEAMSPNKKKKKKKIIQSKTEKERSDNKQDKMTLLKGKKRKGSDMDPKAAVVKIKTSKRDTREGLYNDVRDLFQGPGLEFGTGTNTGWFNE